jgi:hypothetical protein
MTGLIAIDESGDLGENGTRFFVMAAIISGRSRRLLSTYKKIPIKEFESKFSNSSDEERNGVLNEIATTDTQIVYVCVDKSDYREPYRSGNILYQKAFETLMEKAVCAAPSKDVNIVVDKSRFIKINDMKETAERIAETAGRSIKRCDKVLSASNKCVQIADYVAGAIWSEHEKNDPRFANIIKSKISVARASLRP